MKSISNIKKSLQELSMEINAIKDLRMHKNNSFNRAFSVVLSYFNDLETIYLRLERNILESLKLEREILKRNRFEDKDIITDIGQELRRECSKFDNENKTDLKCLFIFSKIFLDKYSELLIFIFGWRGLKDESITSFLNSIKTYDKEDEIIESFKDNFIDIMEKINLQITEYRDKSIIHDKKSHKETIWFMKSMSSDISFHIGGKNTGSINQYDIINLIEKYVVNTVIFTKNNINKHETNTPK